MTERTDFYRAFEAVFRGSRDEIMARMSKYMPVIDACAVKKSLDLGCGRGEWVELLTRNGADATGVDLDDGMLKEAKALNLPVRRGDAIQAISSADDESLDLVSAFHLIEHISFDLFIDLIENAHRALRPGGILILETPNPDNMRVSGYSFYFDPTHRNPIPPELAKFAVQFAGFSECQALYLHPPAEPERRVEISLRRAIAGTAQDYAIIARKNGGEKPLSEILSIDTSPSFAESSEQFDAAIEQITENLAGLAGAIDRSDEAIRAAMELATEQQQIICTLSAKLSQIEQQTSISRRITRPVTFLNETIRRVLAK